MDVNSSSSDGDAACARSVLRSASATFFGTVVTIDAAHAAAGRLRSAAGSGPGDMKALAVVAASTAQPHAVAVRSMLQGLLVQAPLRLLRGNAPSCRERLSAVRARVPQTVRGKPRFQEPFPCLSGRKLLKPPLRLTYFFFPAHCLGLLSVFDPCPSTQTMHASPWLLESFGG